MKNFIFALFLISASAHASSDQWLDRSHRIFFPPEAQETVALSQSFPAFWWNFVVFQLEDDSPASFAKAGQLCQKLKSFSPDSLSRVECNQGLSELQLFSTDWAEDLPLRSRRPSEPFIREKMDEDLSKASLPTGDRALITLLQSDPLESWRDLQKKVEDRIKIDLPRKLGFFFDEASHRVVIPVQAAFNPAETAKTRVILDGLNEFADEMSWVGPHGSTLRNEEQVARDLKSVSKAGYVILALFGLALFLLRRWRLLLLFPPVFIAVGLGAVVTIALFGSIHGLTLSFGAGIIGLALDYGFNAAFNRKSSAMQTWRSNFIGVATTLVGLFVLMSSSIPLLKQIMVFSAAGLTAGFLIFRFLFHRFPDLYISKSYGISFSPKRFKTVVIGVFLIAALAGFFRLHPNLDMKQFDFEDAKTKSTSQWLYQILNLRPPLFEVNQGPEALNATHTEKAWAIAQGVSVENLANYLPLLETQMKNLSTWKDVDCNASIKGFSAIQTQFFSKFIENTLCHPTVPRSTQDGSAVRSYTEHLHSGDRWLTLWMPSSDSQEALVRKFEPSARSLREIVLAFPKTLGRELSWMAPLSVFFVLLILLFYYRRVDYSLVALIPFLSGLGLFSGAVMFLNLGISFISVIALVMSFGFSFDYAVFSVDHFAFKAEGEADGVWEAISSAACATLAGFTPLLFSKHPVLKHLGQALCLSTIGCYLGAVWGVPGAMSILKRESK